jgi:hypothetical protein
MRRRFRRVALAITAVVVVAIAGGVTYALADIGSGGVINGCYKSQNGQLRLIDPATDSCLPNETAISWGQTGPQGPPGPSGLPPVDRFTPTQIVSAAILTCASTSATATSTTCLGLKLNGLDVRALPGEGDAICNVVTGAGEASGGGGPADVPYFIWNGSTWVLATSPDFALNSLTCNLS